MDNFEFLKKNLVPSEKESNNLIYNDYKHKLFILKSTNIEEINKIIRIPMELYDFYKKIGYGFFWIKNEKAFNRLLDPFSFKQINLREDFYEFDPDLELYDDVFYSDKDIFFEVNEGVYLLLKKEDTNKKNAIYYFKQKIADSLEEFLIKFDQNENYYHK